MSYLENKAEPSLMHLNVSLISLRTKTREVSTWLHIDNTQLLPNPHRGELLIRVTFSYIENSYTKKRLNFQTIHLLKLADYFVRETFKI